MNEEIQKLIDDEIEAVQGYDKAIKIFKGNKKIVDKLEEIRRDELEHIEELNKLNSKVIMEEVFNIK